MRIVHVVEALDRGGLERMVIDLAVAQSRRGHDVRVVCLFHAGTLAGELEVHAIPVTACGKRAGADLRALARLRRALAAARPQVMHTHNAVAHYHAVAAAAGLGIGRCVNTRHGMGVLQAHARREWLFRAALPRTDAVAMVCEAARAAAVASQLIPARKLVAVPNGIRVDAFAPCSAVERHRLAVDLGLPPRTRIVGTVGRLNWAKDPQNMVAAFARLHRHLGETALVWVGDGAERGALRRRADAEGVGDRVVDLGDRGDVPRLLQGFSVFALSSVTEGYSMALLEACAAALPIVATDVGGNREIVRDRVNGRLVPASDPGALADALAEVLGDPAACGSMGEAGRAFALRSGSVEAMADRYERLYAAA